MLSQSTKELDVRPLLNRGEEPFPAIMQAVAQLTDGESLCLIAPFEPKPLYQILETKGYEACPQQEENGLWKILFKPKNEGDAAADSDTREMDLRHLEPPGPMQTALEKLSALGRDETLIIHTRFRPIHLLLQIEDQGFEADTEEIGEDHWVTRLWRVPEE